MHIETVMRKAGPKYRCKFSVDGREYCSSWLDTERLAKNWAAQKRVQVLDGREKAGSDMKLSEFAELWFEQIRDNKEAGSLRRDADALKHFLPRLGEISLRKLRTVNVDFALSGLKREGKLAPKTLNNYLGSLNKMLNDAVRWEFIDLNPASRVSRMKVTQQQVKILYADEVDRLLSHTEARYPTVHELAVFALNTGCRLGECLALDHSKVDFVRKRVVIDSTYDSALKRIVTRTKGKRFRCAPLNDETIALLQNLGSAKHASASRLLFPTVTYHYLSSELFTKVLGGAGLHHAVERGATFHSLRHTFASEFMRTGGNLWDLQHILGHSTIKQTEQYAHFAPDFLAGATQRVSFGLKKPTMQDGQPQESPQR